MIVQSTDSINLTPAQEQTVKQAYFQVWADMLLRDNVISQEDYHRLIKRIT